MRIAFLLIALLAAPALAFEVGPEADISPIPGVAMIDATQLTPAELLAMAHAERQAPGALSCCDWSGGNCMDARKILGTVASGTGDGRD